MALTRKEYTGNGSTTLYNVDFDLGYIDKDYVYVYLEGNEYTNQLDYTWQNNTQIELNTPVNTGVKFYIRRVIPRDTLVNDYTNGALLREGNLNNSYKQVLMIMQEVQDGFTVPDDEEFLILSKIILAQDLDAQGNKIVNLGDATEPTDAVNKRVAENIAALQRGADVVVNTLDDLGNVVTLREGLNTYIRTTAQTFIYVIDDGESEGQWVEKDQLGDDVDVNAASYYTLVEAQSVGLKVGQYVALTDYNNASYKIVDNTDSGGYYLPIDANKKLRLVNDSVIDSASVGESDLYQLATIYNSVNNATSLSLTGEITASQNTTISFPTTINFGAVIKPANGVIVSIGVKPTILSSGFKVFDTSLGGEFSLTSTPNIDEVHACWFGMTPYDNSEVVAKSNMKAIADALKMAGSLGVGLQAIGRTPTCLLPVGVYTLDLPTGATEGAVIESYVHLLGYGDSSYYSVREGAPSFDVFVVNTPAANSVVIDKFQLDGNQGAQVNTHNGLVFNTPVGAVIYSEVGDSLYIKEMSGHGIKIIGAGVNNSVIKPKLVRDCKLGNLFVSACDQLDVEGSYRSSKGSSPSIHFNGSGVQVARLNNVTSEENGGYNLLVENTNTETGYVSAHVGSYSRGGSSGVRFDNVTDGGVFDSDISRNAVNGVYLNNTTNVAVKSNRIKANKQRGVLGVSADDGAIKLNEFDKNSDTNINVYDDITLITSSYNDMQLNKFRNSLSTTRYNIAIDDTGCVSNLVANNDLRGSGNTGTISDAGTSTVTTSGNRV